MTNKAFERLVIIPKQYDFYLIRLMDPMQNVNKLESYRRQLRLQHAFVNFCNKVWAFIDEAYDVDVLVDMEQQLTLRLINLES